MAFRVIKGTKDILPAESGKWQYVENSLRRVFHSFQYQEIRTPAFENTGLFARGIGELTDIVGKEMYTFTDRSGDSVTLKPEGTASVIRAYIQHNLGESLPLVKVYYFSPMFRQERPQAGRLRQFHQFGAEAIGSAHPETDSEIIALTMQMYERFSIPGLSLKLNSVGCEKCRPHYRDVLRRELKSRESRLSEESRKRIDQNPMRVLDSKDEDDQTAIVDLPLILDYLCEECRSHFLEVQHHLQAVHIPFAIEGRLVRGLDYYTKTAFELTSSFLGSQDALAGGGRYDLLTQELGGKSTPAVGFAAGIERLLMVLNALKHSFPLQPSPILYLAAADEKGRECIWQTAMDLRKNGLSVEIDFLRRSLKSQMREADRLGVHYTLVIGSSEIESGNAILKSMKRNGKKEIAIKSLRSELNHLQEMILSGEVE